MSRSFVTTQLVTEAPLVLVVGTPHSPLVAEISAVFAQQHLTVSQADFSAITPEILLEPWYKVVVVVSPQDSTQTVTAALGQLLEVPAKLYVVYPITSSCMYPSATTTPELQLWQQQQSRVSSLVAVAPHAQWVVVQDLVVPVDHPQTLSPVLVAIGECFKHASWPAPSTALWYPISFSVAVKKIVSLLAQPSSSTSHVVRGVSRPLVDTFKAYWLYTKENEITLSKEVELVYPQNSSPLPFRFSAVESDDDSYNELLPAWFATLAVVPVEKTPYDTPRSQPSLAKSPPLPSPTPTPPKNVTVVVEKVVEKTQKPTAPLASPLISSATLQKETAHAVPPNQPTPPTPPARPPLVVTPTVPLTPAQPLQPVASAAPATVTATAPTTQHQKKDELSSQIEQLFSFERAEQKVSRMTEQVVVRKQVVKKTKKRKFLFYSGLVSAACGMAALFLSGIYVFSQSMLHAHLNALATTFAQQEEISEAQWQRLQLLQSAVAVQTQVYSKVFDLLIFDTTQRSLELSSHLKEAHSLLAEASETSKSIVLAALGRDSQDIAKLTETMAINSQKAYESLSLVQANLDQMEHITEDWDPQAAQTFTQLVQDARKSSAIHQQLQPQLQSLLGMTEKRTYALLFQNNQELRPTGGFIKAVALVTFDKGSLVSQQVLTSYEIDALVKGEVVAPQDVERFLREKRLYFRDSNWDPDFVETASRVTWYLQQAYPVSIDGVVALNITSAQELIGALGPIDLPEFGEVLTHKNLAERMEFHSEEILVETAAVKDYSKVFLSALLQKIQTVPEDKIHTLLDVAKEQFANQELFVSFARPQELAAVKALGWTGQILTPSCPAEFSSGDCLVDTIAHVDANVGINKANYYLQRNDTHEVVLSPTQALHTHSVKYTNMAKTNSWPRGPYKVYTRVYVPNAAVVQKVSVNGTEVPQEQLIKTTDKNKTVVGVAYEVPINSTIDLQVQYFTPLPSSFATNKKWSYVLFNQKQSGVSPHATTVRFTTSPGMVPVTIAPQATVSGPQIEFASQSESHTLFAVEISKLD